VPCAVERGLGDLVLRPHSEREREGVVTIQRLIGRAE
jgi:hypothetical protein